MARYTIKAANEGGELNLLDPLTIDEALHKSVEQRDRGFYHIILKSSQQWQRRRPLGFVRGWKSKAQGSA